MICRNLNDTINHNAILNIERDIRELKSQIESEKSHILYGKRMVKTYKESIKEHELKLSKIFEELVSKEFILQHIKK